MAVDAEASSSLPEEEIKLYTIKISSRYLNLTRQKLQITRLPHNVPQPQKNDEKDWWEPKATLGPLIDYWLQEYSWRDEEANFNANVPQFRAAIRTASSELPVKLHFIHSRSIYTNAVPLLLIPPFPLTNLSLVHLISIFTTPDDPSQDIPFHLIIPSLPGQGFSDAINSNEKMLPFIAQLFDALMKRLGYQYYLTSNTTPSPNSITDIDFRLVNQIALSYSDSCLGVHLISPPFKAPTMHNAPLEWLKWKTAMTLRTPCLGYSQEDIIACRQQARRPAKHMKLSCVPDLGTEMNKLVEPNMLAYALCDSPTGLLLYIVLVMRILGPGREFPNKDIIQMAQLTWLSTPEGMMRLWVHCSSSFDDPPVSSRRPKVGITTFVKAEDDTSSSTQQSSKLPLPVFSTKSYTCLAWGKSKYNILFSQSIRGSTGLLAWDRPDVIAAGVRGLAKAVIANDKRLQATEEPGVALLEQVEAGVGNQVVPAGTSGSTIQGKVLPFPGPVKVHEDDVTKRSCSEDVIARGRPPTSLFPFIGGSGREEVMEKNGSSSQGSNGGSQRTIRPPASVN